MLEKTDKQSAAAPKCHGALIAKGHCILLVGGTAREPVDFDSGTGESDVAAMVLDSPNASGHFQCGRPLTVIEYQPQDLVYAGGFVSWAGTKRHGLSTNIPDRQEYHGIVRNTSAHTITDPRDEQESQVIIDSSRFLLQLYRTIDKGQEYEAMRLVYKYFYQLRIRQDYLLCDRILEDVDENRLSPTLLVALLTITAPLKQEVGNRAFFYNRAKGVIARQRGADAAERILIGLK